MSAAAFDAVLARIDADLEQALERLFAPLCIKSISTDPAYAGDCRNAAEHLVRDRDYPGLQIDDTGAAGFADRVKTRNAAGAPGGFPFPVPAITSWPQ